MKYSENLKIYTYIQLSSVINKHDSSKIGRTLLVPTKTKGFISVIFFEYMASNFLQ